jgi:hypothetical protein
VTCLSYAAEQAPVDEPVIVLDGNGDGPVNHVCEPSAVAPTYAPSGATLVSATVLGAARDPGVLEKAAREQLRGWFGAAVDGWKHLRTDQIAHAVPAQPPGRLEPPERPVRFRQGLFACGDHLDNASINGALTSGRRAADEVQIDLSR